MAKIKTDDFGRWQLLYVWADREKADRASFAPHDRSVMIESISSTMSPSGEANQMWILLKDDEVSLSNKEKSRIVKAINEFLSIDSQEKP